MTVYLGETVRRGEIYWVKLDPTIGAEIKKTRPAVVISNDSQNKLGRRYIVAPITSVVKTIYPFKVKMSIKETASKVMLDQIRTIDIVAWREKLVNCHRKN